MRRGLGATPLAQLRPGPAASPALAAQAERLPAALGGGPLLCPAFDRRPIPPERGGGALPRAALLCLLLGGCGGGGGSGGGAGGDGGPPPPPAPPVTLSLAVSGSARVEEAANPKVQVSVALDAPASGALAARLELAGSATLGRDYRISAAELAVPAGATSASAEIDVYRDFDKEGDETIVIGLGAITGNARAGDAAQVTLTLLDGEAASVDKGIPDDADEGEVTLDLLAFGLTEDAVVLSVAASIFSDSPRMEPAPLVAEWSTDRGFQTGVNVIRACYGPSGDAEVSLEERRMEPCRITSSDDPLGLLLEGLREFRLPLARLERSRRYFFRAWLLARPDDPMRGGEDHSNVAFAGFATDSRGRVAVRCEAPGRTPAAGGGDPLFGQQWHLANTGQTAFSARGGVAGADLRMSSAIAAGRGGAGVKLAVVDTGLELCHPDLASNTRAGGSFNFGGASTPGASPADPFNFSTLGDHGTSVAGIAAAAAGNGLGGRGVAPEVALVAFNPLEGAAVEGEDADTTGAIAFMKSLGASDSDPDSASVDVFNMSFGYEAPAENATEEIERVLRMGATRLRSGRGALYVKAAGNAFGDCEREHPFHREAGCVSSNSDPEQNIPWLVVVGGFNADDVKSSYSSAGANLWVVGPSGEDGVGAPGMITTDQAGPLAGYSAHPGGGLGNDNPLNRDGDYTSAFGGTSAAAPAVAGAIAILLGARPALTWRDVRHILASTARRIDPDIAESRAAFNGAPYIAQHAWQTNAAGYGYHNWYGFGAVDVDAALAMAARHAPDSLGRLVESGWFAGPAAGPPLAIPDADGAGVTATMAVSGLPAGADLEAVVLEISARHGAVFDLGITLRSPSGTASVVNPPFNTLFGGPFDAGLNGWRLLSNAFYGENPNGAWALHVADLAPGHTGSLSGWRLRFYYGEHGAN